ncbi:MAG: alpha/beta hydrolase [Rhodocyclales bacterium]|nr:alpha/beta hydrolase [Rhodocyclales bacterium]
MAMLLARRASLALVALLVSACSAWEPDSSTAREFELPSAWRAESLAGSLPARRIVALRREAAQGPASFRLVVIPGSGCTGFAPFAARYFSGLTKAQVIVLHKPYADLYAGPAPAECPPEFVRHDALRSWRDDALAALRQVKAGDAVPLPTIVLGISEGAEIIPYLLPAIPNPLGMVLLSATGLDPAIAGEMQAEKLGQGQAWKRLQEAAASKRPDEAIVEGRSLRYWRDLFGWKLTAALVEAKLPVLRVWGGDDALLPQQAYERLHALPAGNPLSVCDWRLDRADHGLQGQRGDGVQLVWERLENWATTGRLDCGEGMRQRR